MSGWAIFWLIILVLVVVAVLVNLRDIKRYLRIRKM